MIQTLDRFHSYLDEPRLLNRALWYAWKVLCGMCVVGIVAIFYFTAAEATAHRSTDLMTSVDARIPFMPWTWWIYFPGYLTGLFITVLAFRDTQALYRCLAAILLASALCTFGFFILPSAFPRPALAPGSISADAMRWFWSIDPANNTFPSKHCAIAILAAIGLGCDPEARAPFKWLAAASALGVVISVHTTKQHYVVDSLSGAAIAVASWWVVTRAWPRWQDRTSELRSPNG